MEQRLVYEFPRLERFFRRLFYGYFRLFHFARFHGLEHLPPPGPCLFAANHQSYYDPMLIAVGQPLPIRYMAWNALFNGGIAERYLRFMGAFPVDPDGNDPGGYRVCLDALKRGNRVLIFPEGGRSYDGRLTPFREGVARLAMRTGVPIVPVCVRGGEHAWPRAETIPRPFTPMEVWYLPVIHPRPARTPGERHEESRRLTEEMTRVIQARLDSDGTEAVAHAH